MDRRNEWVRAQDLPAILEMYAVAKDARRRRWRKLRELAPWLVFWLVCAVLGVLAGLLISGAWGAERAGDVTQQRKCEMRGAERGEDNRPPSAPRSALRVSCLLDAIRQVESGNRPEPPDGDGGRSIGPYQIQRAYWGDARVPWPYQAVRGEAEARATVLAYWRRWAPAALAAGDLETLARIHNGGPDGAAKHNTLAYWRRVLKETHGGPERG